MGSSMPENEENKELNDSGCVQDDVSCKQSTDNSKCPTNNTQLLDLSDDVLLCILRHCTPMDLKALGYSCARLGVLIRDRTLWHRVDGRGQPHGRVRLRWLLTHALNSNTSELHLSGFAMQTKGCLGHVNRNRKDAEDENNPSECPESDGPEPAASTSQPQERPWRSRLQRQLQRVYIHPLPRLRGSPCWPEEEPRVAADTDKVIGTCPGPQFTLTPCMMKQLSHQCNLTSLTLEYININCNTTGLNLFPPTLKKLSLCGTKCFNLPLDKSFLFKIQDCLPQLESIDVSECEWMEPPSLLPLSKMESLQRLYLRDCYRLSEFVAYASLSTRYGFRNLKYLDLRGSPLGDSEVSALGWLPLLEELYLSAPVQLPGGASTEHTHYKDDVLPPNKELDDWEKQEPSCFKTEVKQRKSKGQSKHRNGQNNNKCFHGLEFNQCMEGVRENNTYQTYDKDNEAENDLKRKIDDDSDETDAKPGPSKRTKTDQNSSQEMTSSSEGDDSSDNDDDAYVVPTKKSRPNGTADGPSTSENQPESADNQNGEPNATCQNAKPKSKKKKRRSQSEDINRNEADNNEPESGQRNRVLRPSAHVLYVNVGQQLHTVYRLAIPNEPGGGLHVINNVRSRNNMGHILYTPTPQIDASILVTDSGVRAFGHSDDCVNYVHIGPPGPQPEGSHRPTKSNLRVLSITGYRHISNRSLEHLATAAPRLRVLNFSETRVTSEGVEAFKALRPDVEVVFSEYKAKEE